MAAGLPNWRVHLDRANQTRYRAAALRRRLAVDPAALEEVLSDPAIARLAVGRVIAWLPHWGAFRGDELLRSMDPPIGWNHLCGQLTDRQRRLLGEATRPR